MECQEVGEERPCRLDYGYIREQKGAGTGLPLLGAALVLTALPCAGVLDNASKIVVAREGRPTSAEPEVLKQQQRAVLGVLAEIIGGETGNVIAESKAAGTIRGAVAVEGVEVGGRTVVGDRDQRAVGACGAIAILKSRRDLNPWQVRFKGKPAVRHVQLLPGSEPGEEEGTRMIWIAISPKRLVRHTIEATVRSLTTGNGNQGGLIRSETEVNIGTRSCGARRPLGMLPVVGEALFGAGRAHSEGRVARIRHHASAVVKVADLV